MIFERSEQIRERMLASFAEQLWEDETVFNNMTDSYEEVMSDLVGKEFLANTSSSLIDNNTLLVICHGGDRHLQKKLVLKKAVVYQDKQISKILYFKIGHGDNVNRFCEYIRETINKHV